jgi:3-methyladenine DNA glycosylase/8-oxoguanine DNA glycosylase
MSTIRIATPPDFRFDVTVESHGWYALAPFEWSAETRVLRRAETPDGTNAFDLRITFDRGLVVRMDGGASGWLGGASAASRPPGGGASATDSPARGSAASRRPTVLHARLRRMFQLDLELGEFHRRCAATETHAAIARKKFGRLLCGSTLFEDAVKIIATTNTTWRQTKRMVASLVELCGPRSKSGRAAFPAPQNVAASSIAELREVCRMGYRADSVYRLASGIAEGSIDLAALSDPRQSTEELFRSYLQLPGIGPYGAAHLLAMDGRHDFIAVDTEFRSFVRGRYHGGRKVADKTLLRRYAKWDEWKYLAYWSELWESS